MASSGLIKMKVLQVFVSVLLISLVAAQAPYPPSGYRPQGPQFSLPTEQQPRNQYGPPLNNQYGSPDNVQKPTNQYIPSLEPTDVRNFDVEQSTNGWTTNQPINPQQNPNTLVLSNNNFNSRRYLTPNQNRPENADNRQDQRVASQNYLPPDTEPATPRTREPLEPQDVDDQRPNVAVSTAVAKGQYYLLQPNGKLQKINYETTQTEEEVKNNEFSSQLIYQNIEPLTGPIFTYNAPLLKIN